MKKTLAFKNKKGFVKAKTKSTKGAFLAKNVKMYTPDELISLKNKEANKYADFSQEEKDFQVSDDESRIIK